MTAFVVAEADVAAKTQETTNATRRMVVIDGEVSHGADRPLCGFWLVAEEAPAALCGQDLVVLLERDPES